MEDLKGKKLLVLGGSAMSKDIVNMAHSMGVYVIVTDYYDIRRSPAKLIADEYWDVSINDYEELTHLIKENHIDGIFTSFTDSYLLPYQHLCELNNLPFYASLEAFEMGFNKAKFKETCNKYGIPTVPQYDLKTFDPLQLSEQNAVILKPVDNSGARGITYCDSATDFPVALENALSYSPSKNVIIEKYIRNGGTSMSVRYIAVDGELYLQAVGDRYVMDDTNGNALITAAAFYPSKHTQYYIDTLDEKVKRMFKGVGIRDGALFMESFFTDEGIYFYEMGLRLSGGQTYNMTEIATGANELRMLIRYALTGHMCNKEECQLINPWMNGYAMGSITVPLRKGTIAKITGLDEIKSVPHVYAVSQLHQVGDVIQPEHQGTLLSLLSRISIVVKDITQLNEIIDLILHRVSVIDTEGNEMFISDKIRKIHLDYSGNEKSIVCCDNTGK